jgi:hypothetical protein
MLVPWSHRGMRAFDFFSWPECILLHLTTRTDAASPFLPLLDYWREPSPPAPNGYRKGWPVAHLRSTYNAYHLAVQCHARSLVAGEHGQTTFPLYLKASLSIQRRGRMLLLLRTFADFATWILCPSVSSPIVTDRQGQSPIAVVAA